jgi:hypothetical protein
VLAIVGSLGFVGYQIRRKRRALRATAHQAVSDSFSAINRLIASDPGIARLRRVGLSGLDTLDDDEPTSFGFIALAHMRIFEMLHYQSLTGGWSRSGSRQS